MPGYRNRSTEEENGSWSEHPDQTQSAFDDAQVYAEEITRRKEAEKQFEQEKNLTQLYLDVAGVMIVALDRHGRVTLVNQAGCELLGYPADEIVGKDWFVYFLPERDRAPVREVFETLLAGDVEAVEYYENAVLIRGGEERVILWHNAILRNEQGAVIGTLGSGTDITGRRRAEETNRRLAAIVESSEDAIIGKTLDGIITSWNKGAVQMYGYAAEDVVGRPITIIVPEDRKEEVTRFMATIKRGERIDHFETVRVRKDGSHIQVSLGISPVYDAEGTLIGASAIARDITGRKQAERALHESEARAHAVLDTTVDAVLTIDEQGRIESVNPATECLFGYAAEEMIGHNVTMLMPPPYRDEHDRYLRNYLETGVKKIIGIGREVLARRKDGTVFPIDLAVSEVCFGDRRIFTGFIRDISERRALEREVLRISEEERRHIGQDIHDGLASQFSGIALLSRGLINQHKKGQAVSAEMLEEIAHLARTGAGQARALARGLNPLSLDREGLRAALKELAHSAETLSGMAYTLEVDEALPPLERGVATQLYRIAQEAVTNAVKHAAATHLLLQVQRRADRLVLTVADDGRGLPEEFLEGAGGMGLHIMPYRARMLGAALRIDSAPGAGTTVICAVPLAGPPPSA